MNKEHPSCKICGRFLAEGLEEWDDSLDLLCFGKSDTKCTESVKKALSDIAAIGAKEEERSREICSVCGSLNCFRFWPQQIKCCPDCSHK